MPVQPPGLKIVRAGVLPGPDMVRGTCDNCKCEVVLPQRESLPVEDATKDSEHFIFCPTEGCGEKLYLWRVS